MFNTLIYNGSETAIIDVTGAESIKWKRFVTDRRFSKDVGLDTVDLFDGDRFEIEPKYFIAKTYEYGTSFKRYLHAVMTNGDEIFMRSMGVRSSLERDQLQEYSVNSIITINDEEFKTDKFHDFNRVCDFYFRWIETRPENFKKFEITF
jgi:hypothetical protein